MCNPMFLNVGGFERPSENQKTARIGCAEVASEKTHDAVKRTSSDCDDED